MRICDAPDCSNSLEGMRADAECCSRACSAARSRYRRGLTQPADEVQAFREGFARLAEAPRIDLRQRARELREKAGTAG